MNTIGKDVLDEILANRKVITFMKLYYINRKLEKQAVDSKESGNT